LEDIISLHYFGLESGITLDDVESLPTTAIELVEQKLELYGLDIGKLALYEKFENITGKHFE
jgi:hypothetical protein